MKYFMWARDFTPILTFSVFSENVSHDKRTYFETVCQNDEVHISCDYGRPPAIQVLTAQWGRIKKNICPKKYAENDVCKSDVIDSISMRYFLF